MSSDPCRFQRKPIIIGKLRDDAECFLPTPNAASYEALPVLPYSPVFFSPVSYACLATLRVDFFKRMRVQPLDLRNGNLRSLMCSVIVAEVTQVNSIPACWQASQYPLSRLNLERCMSYPVSKFPGRLVRFYEQASMKENGGCLVCSPTL